MFVRAGQEQWQVADDEVDIIRATGSTSESVVFEPEAGICFPSVPCDVRWQSVPLWEWGVVDPRAEYPGPWCMRARALVLYAVGPPIAYAACSSPRSHPIQVRACERR